MFYAKGVKLKRMVVSLLTGRDANEMKLLGVVLMTFYYTVQLVNNAF